MKVSDHDLVERVLAGLATPSEAREVAKWMATKEGQTYVSKQFDKDAENITNEKADLLIDHDIPTDKIWGKIQSDLKKKQLKKYIWRIAAILIPFVLIWGLYIELDSQVNLFAADQYEEVYVPRGERIQIMFQDGTKVYLNSDSYLKYPHKFALGKRIVELRGEAYFKVTKNQKRPFIVDLKGSSIKVLGTSFNVEAYPEEEQIIVQLDEGKIRFALDKQKGTQLKPGERLIYNKTTNAITLHKVDNLKDTSVWKENVISFNNEPIDQVLKKLERWFDVRFMNEKELPENLFITLTSKYASLNDVLLDLNKITNLSFGYNKIKKEVIIK